MKHCQSLESSPYINISLFPLLSQRTYLTKLLHDAIFTVVFGRRALWPRRSFSCRPQRAVWLSSTANWNGAVWGSFQQCDLVWHRARALSHPVGVECYSEAQFNGAWALPLSTVRHRRNSASARDRLDLPDYLQLVQQTLRHRSDPPLQRDRSSLKPIKLRSSRDRT